MRYLPWVLASLLLGVGYGCHAKSVVRLEGEIKARGESIKQLSQLAAKKQQAYHKAKTAYTIKPSLETCSVVLSSCEQMHEADSSQIVLLNKQIDDYKKLKKKDKLFGFLPRPTLQAGYCVMLNATGPCLSGGFPILK